jgi:hypothetical protein
VEGGLRQYFPSSYNAGQNVNGGVPGNIIVTGDPGPAILPVMAAPVKDSIALYAKLQWAEEHIFKLKESWDVFIEEDSFPVRFQDTPDGSYRMYYLGPVAPIRVEFPLMTGDVIHNLRSALDHLAYRLVCVGTASSGPFDRVYFPIGGRPDKFEGQIQTLKKYLRPDAIKPLTEIHAYPGGPGELLWQIHQFNNIDKHRLLLTITSQNRLRSMSPAEISKIRTQFIGMKDIPEANDPRMFLKAGVRHLALEANHVLDIFPRSEVHENMHFPIEIAFGEPETVKGKSVVETLHLAAGRVRNIIMRFDNDGLLD